MDYWDLLDEERSYEDIVTENEFRRQFEKEEMQLKYLEEMENKNGRT